MVTQTLFVRSMSMPKKYAYYKIRLLIDYAYFSSHFRNNLILHVKSMLLFGAPELREKIREW